MLCILKDETAELDLQYIIEQANWYGKDFVDRIVCINQIKSADILNVCKKIARINNIKITVQDELLNVINLES